MATDMTFAIELRRVTVARSGKAVVRDASTQIPIASWFGVIGANGSGKTTLLRAIAGRLSIATGACEIFGTDHAGNRSERAMAIGFAPPIERLPALLRVRQLLEFAGETIEAQQDRCQALWQALGINALLDTPAGECSSGMRQRAALALAFARPTRVVILDEPFNWLDPVAAFDARAALASMVKEGLTLVTALHDLTTLCGFCDNGIVMSKGRISLELDQPTLRGGNNDLASFEKRLVAALR